MYRKGLRSIPQYLTADVGETWLIRGGASVRLPKHQRSEFLIDDVRTKEIDQANQCTLDYSDSSSTGGCIKNRAGRRLRPRSVRFSQRRFASFAWAGLQHPAERWQRLRMEVCRGRLCEWGCVFQWQTSFAGYPQHFLVPDVRCELNNRRAGRL